MKKLTFEEWLIQELKTNHAQTDAFKDFVAWAKENRDEAATAFLPKLEDFSTGYIMETGQVHCCNNTPEMSRQILDKIIEEFG